MYKAVPSLKKECYFGLLGKRNIPISPFRIVSRSLIVCFTTFLASPRPISNLVPHFAINVFKYIQDHKVGLVIGKHWHITMRSV